MSIICWNLIIAGGVMFLRTGGVGDLSVPANRVTCVGAVINIVAGIAMLKGCNWGRLLYAIGKGILGVIVAATSFVSEATIASWLIFLIVVCVLFSSNSADFFRGRDAGAGVSPQF